MDKNNALRYDGGIKYQTNLESAWGTTWWTIQVFAFFMVYTEVNVYLTIKYFQKNDETFMDFGKMANALIHNSYINYCLIGLNELFFLQTFENKIR